MSSSEDILWGLRQHRRSIWVHLTHSFRRSLHLCRLRPRSHWLTQPCGSQVCYLAPLPMAEKCEIQPWKWKQGKRPFPILSRKIPCDSRQVMNTLDRTCGINTSIDLGWICWSHLLKSRFYRLTVVQWAGEMVGRMGEAWDEHGWGIVRGEQSWKIWTWTPTPGKSRIHHKSVTSWACSHEKPSEHLHKSPSVSYAATKSQRSPEKAASSSSTQTNFGLGPKERHQRSKASTWKHQAKLFSPGSWKQSRTSTWKEWGNVAQQNLELSLKIGIQQVWCAATVCWNCFFCVCSKVKWTWNVGWATRCPAMAHPVDLADQHRSAEGPETARSSSLDHTKKPGPKVLFGLTVRDMIL